MKPPAPSEQELLERFQQRRATPQVPDALSPLSEAVRLALALLPTSTVDALKALDPECESIPAALQALHDQGLLEADAGALPSADGARRPASSFIPAVRPAAKLRQRVLDAFGAAQRDAAMAAHALSAVSRHVGATLVSAAIELPETTSRWVQLAAAGPDAAARLDEETRGAAERLDSADLSRWLDAAAPLATLFERDKDLGLRLAVERGSRQLELLRREQADRRHLQTFFERPEQLAPLEAFLDPRGERDRWMLHLLGSGGVGKTMLIRHLTLEMAKAKGFLSARVDFDFLSPDYPRLDPGLLLWSLGRELQLRTTNEEAVRALREAEGRFRHLSNVLRNEPGADTPNVRATRHQYFVEAAFLFVSALKQAGAPILIVLDTCEELVKGRGRGGVSDAVAETFRILHALRYGARTLLDETPTPGEVEADVRVVFAGRRPLASAGDGWTAISDLEPRPALQVFELRGFSTAEAEEWLGRDLKVPLHLVPAVIAATPDIDAGARVTWADARPPRPIGKNPYDLKHFADWAKETPPPAPEVLAGGSPRQYVEERILSKLDPRPELERFLAALSLVKHADRDLLRAVVDVDLFDERLAVLTAHEWIVRRVVIDEQDAPREIYQLEERLRRRLRDYFEEIGVDFATIGARASGVLAARTLERDLAFVDVADVDATLRAFEPDPEAGRAWWRAFVERVIARRDVDALLRHTDFLLGDEQAAGSRRPQDGPEHPLRAQVMADQAAALARGGDLAASARDWLGVGAGATAVLRCRAVMGQIAASVARADDAGLVQAWEQWSASAVRVATTADARAEVCVGLVAALEALVERLEGLQQPVPPAVGAALFRATEPWAGDMNQAAQGDSRIPAAVAAMWWALCGRAVLYTRREPNASPWFLTAIAAARRLDHAGAASPLLLDWTPPANTLARVTLEGLRHGAALDVDAVRLEQVDRSVQLSGYDRAGLDEDRDRLWSLLLVYQTNRSLPGVDEPGGRSLAGQVDFSFTLSWSSPAITGRSGINAHRLIPPLAITGARIACERGQLSTGLSRLMTAAGDAALDFTVRAHAARALAHLAALLRRPFFDRGVLGESHEPNDLWMVARTRFVCDRLADPQIAAALRAQVDDVDLLLGFIGPERAGPAAERLPPHERWRITPGRVSAGSGPLIDSRRGARIEAVASELLERRRNARSMFDAGDLLGFTDTGRTTGLLDAAAARFEETGDWLGAFAARARLAVLAAATESPDVAVLEQTLESCRVALEHVQQAAPAERWTDWDAIVDGEPLVSHAGTVTDWPFRLALCHVRLRDLRKETPKRESLFADRKMVYLLHGPLADALQMIGRDPWQGETGAEVSEPAWQRALWWRVVKNWPGMRRLIAALIRAAASLVDTWMQIVRPGHAAEGSASPLLLRLEQTAAAIDVPPESSDAVDRLPDAPAAATEPSAAPIAVEPTPAPAARGPATDEPDPAPTVPAPKMDAAYYVAIGVAILILVGIVVGGFFAVRPLIRWAFPQGDGNPAPVAASGTRVLVEIGVYVALLIAAAFVSTFAADRLSRERRRRSRLVLELSSPDTTTLIGEIAVKGAVQRSRFPFRRARFTLMDPWLPWTVDLLAGSLQTQESELAVSLLQISPSTQRIEILSTGWLARRAPWDLLLARRLQVHPSTLRISHRAHEFLVAADGTLVAVQHADTSALASGVELLTGHEASSQFAAQAWRSAGHEVLHYSGGLESEWPAGASRQLHRVEHCVGDVESRGAEVQLRLSGTGGALAPAALSRVVGRPALLILQGPLRPELAKREDSDRLEAAARRELAYRLHDTGIPLVLVLPRFDPPLMESVLHRVASAASAARGVEPWLDVVAAIRADIVVHCGDTDDGRELAGDVSLFAGDWEENVLG